MKVGDVVKFRHQHWEHHRYGYGMLVEERANGWMINIGRPVHLFAVYKQIIKALS